MSPLNYLEPEPYLSFHNGKSLLLVQIPVSHMKEPIYLKKQKRFSFVPTRNLDGSLEALSRFFPILCLEPKVHFSLKSFVNCRYQKGKYLYSLWLEWNSLNYTVFEEQALTKIHLKGKGALNPIVWAEDDKIFIELDQVRLKDTLPFFISPSQPSLLAELAISEANHGLLLELTVSAECTHWTWEVPTPSSIIFCLKERKR